MFVGVFGIGLRAFPGNGRHGVAAKISKCQLNSKRQLVETGVFLIFLDLNLPVRRFLPNLLPVNQVKERMKKVLQEFRQFAMRGNVVDMAVGVIIGGAFGKIVSSVVADIIMPPIGLLVGGVNFSDLRLTLKDAVVRDGVEVVPAVTLNYGNFIQVTLDFVIIAAAVFLLVKGVNALNTKKKESPKAPPAPPADIQLLTEIRDLLKKDKDGAGK